MPNFKSPQEIFDAGYCIPSYCINNDVTLWRYKNTQYEVSGSVVSTVFNEPLRMRMALLEEVKEHAFKVCEIQ